MAKDERWGRTYESYGETPEVVEIFNSLISGLQRPNIGGSNKTVAACAKHWVADGGTVGGRDQGDSVMNEEELRREHIAPYYDAIERKVATIMPSFSSWNGVKLHGHEYLLQTILKDEMGFEGFLISDWAGVDQITGDYCTALAISVRAGMDMIMVPNEYQRAINCMYQNLDNGSIQMSRVDDAVRRILKVKFEYGIFDNPYPTRDLEKDFGSPEHRAVARQAVRESLVLLRNDGILPLSRGYSTVVVSGRHADNMGLQCGGWTIYWQGGSGPITPGTTTYEALQAELPNASFTLNESGNGNFQGDLAVVVVGENPYAEGFGDNQNLEMEWQDLQTIERVCDGSRPCVVILMTGRPMIINSIYDNPNVNALVSAWLPGTEGNGITDVLFATDGADFTGKLSYTWPRSMSQVPINVDGG